MPRRGRHYRVLSRAWRAWEESETGPWTLSEVVDAMEALPESELSVGKEFLPPIVLDVVQGTVYGCRFEIRGAQTPDGRWMEVWRVRPIKEKE